MFRPKLGRLSKQHGSVSDDNGGKLLNSHTDAELLVCQQEYRRDIGDESSIVEFEAEVMDTQCIVAQLNRSVIVVFGLLSCRSTSHDLRVEEDFDNLRPCRLQTVVPVICACHSLVGAGLLCRLLWKG